MTHQEELHAAKLEGIKKGYKAGWDDRKREEVDVMLGRGVGFSQRLATFLSLPPSDGTPAREIPEPGKGELNVS